MNLSDEDQNSSEEGGPEPDKNDFPVNDNSLADEWARALYDSEEQSTYNAENYPSVQDEDSTQEAGDSGESCKAHLEDIEWQLNVERTRRLALERKMADDLNFSRKKVRK